MGCRRVSAVHCDGRAFWIAEAHHRDGKRFDVRAEEKLTAFLELESAIRAFSPAFKVHSLNAGDRSKR